MYAFAEQRCRSSTPKTCFLLPIAYAPTKRHIPAHLLATIIVSISHQIATMVTIKTTISFNTTIPSTNHLQQRHTQMASVQQPMRFQALIAQQTLPIRTKSPSCLPMMDQRSSVAHTKVAHMAIRRPQRTPPPQLPTNRIATAAVTIITALQLLLLLPRSMTKRHRDGTTPWIS